MSETILTVDGRNFAGWESVRITRSMEQIAGTFSLRLTDRWAQDQAARPIRAGASCTVAFGNQTIITGYIDTVAPRYTDSSHTITVTGRDKTGDLVDCSAIHASGEWKGRTLLQIATDICQPFGIPVSADTDIGDKFNRSSIQQGETAFEALERAARMRGVLLISDGVGNLVISRESSARINTGLKRGENIIEASATLSHQERHSSYIVKGQNAGSDWTTAEQHTKPKAEASDPAISRYRPLIIIAEGQGHGPALKNRAQWEANVRAGRGGRATITVQGWAHSGGIWVPNHKVYVDDDFLDLKQEMLIVGVTYHLDEKGTRTVLTLCLPGAFDLIPMPEPKGDATW